MTWEDLIQEKWQNITYVHRVADTWNSLASYAMQCRAVKIKQTKQYATVTNFVRNLLQRHNHF